MSTRTGNLAHCPVCRSVLEETVGRCNRCKYAEIEDADFLNPSDQEKYRQGLADYCASWTGLETSLRERLQGFGSDWGRQENWQEIWAQVQIWAAKLDFDSNDTLRHAIHIWQQLEDVPP